MAPIISVPYALYARDEDFETDNELQQLERTGPTSFELSQGGGAVTIDVNDADADPSNEIQTIQSTGPNSFELDQGGGTVTIDIEDADADPNNELQNISIQDSVITLNQGGGTVTVNVNDPDADPGNEIQEISVVGNEISLSNGGGVATIPPRMNAGMVNLPQTWCGEALPSVTIPHNLGQRPRKLIIDSKNNGHPFFPMGCSTLWMDMDQDGLGVTSIKVLYFDKSDTGTEDLLLFEDSNRVGIFYDQICGGTALYLTVSTDENNITFSAEMIMDDESTPEIDLYWYAEY